ncbi:MAG TPA: hypothetical protein DCW90_10730 [Lachnospiraceae bacterium]|nr:hypothetical protein [Lachnospiraceae bacterium]
MLREVKNFCGDCYNNLEGIATEVGPTVVGTGIGYVLAKGIYKAAKMPNKANQTTTDAGVYLLTVGVTSVVFAVGETIADRIEAKKKTTEEDEAFEA